MIRSAIVAAGLLSAATPATAMDLHSFLTKADALQKRGPLALLSSDYRVLKKVAENAGAELKSERLAIVKAGKPAPYCPPAKAAIASSELLASFRAIPESERSRTTVKDAMRAFLAKKWPCRA